VQLTLDGQAVQIVKRTPADKDGGRDPVWENEILFDVVDQYKLEVKVFHQSMVGGDILLGFAEVSLLQAFRNGLTELWTTLKQRRPNGGLREVGDVLLRLTFLGQTGIAYPQFRPDVDSFDDTLRKAIAPDDQDEAGQEQVKAAISTNPDDPSNNQQALTVSTTKPEFTEAEISAAFRFLDLDKNNYIGAAEIRHILVCMGEMITDEEIDMMIAMVDLDGDGQVSFREFRALVLHPNPGMDDMQKAVNIDRDNELLQDKQLLTGKAPQGLDLQSYQRQKDLMQREQKKRMILSFIDDNEATFDYLQRCYGNFIDIPKERRPGGRVNFDDFCNIFKIEPIAEYRKLHAFYDDEETGKMDIREFLLSMMNYVTVDKDTRLKFVFEMFDELKTGYIAQREVEEILRGNHIVSLLSVQRKADTIMKQAKSSRAGFMTLKEFLVVSQKFPNILFPSAASLQKPKDP
jgi:Ca2+-binding EF-hand superfamily protein